MNRLAAQLIALAMLVLAILSALLIWTLMTRPDVPVACFVDTHPIQLQGVYSPGVIAHGVMINGVCQITI